MAAVPCLRPLAPRFIWEAGTPERESYNPVITGDRFATKTQPGQRSATFTP